MSQITIHHATIQDVPRLSTLLAELLGEGAYFTANSLRQQQGFTLLLQRPDSAQIFVARDLRGEIIGMCTAQLVISTVQGTAAAWIEDLIVLPAFRQQGIASKLLQSATEWTMQQDGTRLQLLVDVNNPVAVALYEKLAWKSTELQARYYFCPNSETV